MSAENPLLPAPKVPVGHCLCRETCAHSQVTLTSGISDKWPARDGQFYLAYLKLVTAYPHQHPFQSLYRESSKRKDPRVPGFGCSVRLGDDQRDL